MSSDNFTRDLEIIARDLDPADSREGLARIRIAQASSAFMGALVGRSSNLAQQRLANETWQNLHAIAYPKSAV